MPRHPANFVILFALWFSVFPVLVAAPAAEAEPTGPSFDCTKASADWEKTVCDDSVLAWYDRQITRAYGIAKEMVGEEGRSGVIQSQERYIKACGDCAGKSGCIFDADVARIAALVAIVNSGDLSASTYESATGHVRLVRYPDKRVAVAISTAAPGAGLHICRFETDKATAGPHGTIRYVAKPDDNEPGCKITLTSKGDTIRVSSSDECYGLSAERWCGTAATLDGTFKKVGNR